jgi:hypothetical protein
MIIDKLAIEIIKLNYLFQTRAEKGGAIPLSNPRNPENV